MNDATLALNVTRPAAHANATSATATAASKGSDESSTSSRFDAAMEAARADARQKAGDDTSSSSSSSSKNGAAKSGDDSKTASAKTSKKSSDDDATKDDTSDDTSDGSLASTMLALIGVPPKITDAASKVPGLAKEGVDKAVGALGGLLGGATAGDAAAANGVAGAKDGMLDALNAKGGEAAVAAPVTTASPFAALLATEGGDGALSRDESKPSDPTSLSPMPLAHAQGATQVDAPVQVQATQAATTPQFAQELGEQIAWMGAGNIKEARIKLHPEELGSMDVRVNVDGGKVNVAIMAQHPAAVHAVQQTLSQLDSMLAHHGLSLGQADVGQRDTSGQGNQGDGSSQSGQGGGDDVAGATTTIATSAVSRGLVDEVA